MIPLPYLYGAVAFGTLYLAYLISVLTVGLLRRSRKRAWDRGHDAGTKEQDAVVYAQRKELLSLQAIVRNPTVGCYEYVVDLDSIPRTLELAKILEVGSDRVQIQVVYKKIDDMIPLTGRVQHVTLIIPDSTQEC
jgi:hypothetical protein